MKRIQSSWALGKEFILRGPWVKEFCHENEERTSYVQGYREFGLGPWRPKEFYRVIGGDGLNSLLRRSVRGMGGYGIKEGRFEHYL